MNRRTLLTSIAALAPAMAGPTARAAPAYPIAPVRVIVPFPPGGITDTIGRIVATRLTQLMGQSFFVDNRSGACGITGTEAVAVAAADGDTLLLASIDQAISVAVYKDQPFDFVADFAPISLIATTPNVLSVHCSVPATNLEELLALIRASPGKYTFGSTNPGGSRHMCGELLKVMAAVNIAAVSYPGVAPMLDDLAAGLIPMAFDRLPSSLPLIRSGRIRGIAVTSATRSAAAPDLPTIAESGLPGYEVSGWRGLMAPSGTPPDVITALYAAMIEALGEDSTRARLLGSGAEPVGSSPAGFAATIKAEIEKWADVVAIASVHEQ
jgi:tripartite-type tricarboxylate transporter receptor subunit TctC